MSESTQAAFTGPAVDVSLTQTVLARPIADRHAVLAYVDGALAAVLVRLDHEAHEDLQGRWVVEIGFGAFDAVPAPTFATLGAAAAWLESVGSRVLDETPRWVGSIRR